MYDNKKTSNSSDLVDLISNNHTYSDTVANETVQPCALSVKGRRPKLHVNVHPNLSDQNCIVKHTNI